MKWICFVKNKAGKFALSAMQAVGLSAAVGVAGIAAWQMMGSSAEPSLNTVFSSNDQEVVFVASGSGAGNYGGNYGTGGELQSGIRTTLSKDMQLMQADAARLEREQSALEQQESKIAAYKMDGAADGLGMTGGNAAKELTMNAGGADMGALQQQIANLKAAALSQQQAAVQQAAAGSAASAASAAMQTPGAAIARASGSNLNSTPLQAAQGAQGENGVSAGGVLGGAQVADAAAMTGSSGLMGSRQGSSSGFGRALEWQGGDRKMELASLQKQSAELTRNKNRAANEGSKIFLAGERLSSGIRLEGDTITTGGASSADFSGDNELGGLGSAASSTQELLEMYEKSKENLQDEIKKYKNTVGATCAAAIIPGLCYAWIWSSHNKIRDKVDNFRDQWKDSSFELTSTPAPYADSADTVVDAIYHYAWAGVIGSPWWAGKADNKKRWNQVFGS